MNSLSETRNQLSAFQLKGSQYTLMTLELTSDNTGEINRQLEAITKKAPGFFDNTPVVVSLDNISRPVASDQLQRIRQLLEHAGMSLIAVRGDESHREGAIQAAIAWLPMNRNQQASHTVITLKQPSRPRGSTLLPRRQQPERKKHSKSQTEHSTRFVEHPVRSGQQIFHMGDLVILNQVSQGAEILASGNIHIYGPLRGRALAGIHGNSEARIVCCQFEAELVSINGQYRLTNQNEPSCREKLWQKSVCIKLINDHLHISSLS